MASKKPDRSRRERKPTKGIPDDAEVSLTPQGRAMYEQFLALASEEAGRPISGEELLEAIRSVRKEVGTDDPDFTLPENVECFKRHLRRIGKPDRDNP